MKGSLLIHLLQFFSAVIVVIVVLMSSYIISFHLFKRNWINSKLASETLASTLASISSSFSNVSLQIATGKACNISISNNKVATETSNEIYEAPINFPDYVKIKGSNSTCSLGFITIRKIDEEVWVE